MYDILFIQSYFLVRGDTMKLGKDLVFMGLGAGAVLAYQKYKKPVMKSVNKMINTKAKKVDKALEDMM